MLICPLGSLLMNKLWTESFIALHLLLLTFSYSLPLISSGLHARKWLSTHATSSSCRNLVWGGLGSFWSVSTSAVYTCNDKRSPLDGDANGTLCVFFSLTSPPYLVIFMYLNWMFVGWIHAWKSFCLLSCQVLLHQACASSDGRAVNTQTSATFEDTQYSGVFSRPGSGEQEMLPWISLTVLCFSHLLMPCLLLPGWNSCPL